MVEVIDGPDKGKYLNAKNIVGDRLWARTARS